MHSLCVTSLKLRFIYLKIFLLHNTYLLQYQVKFTYFSSAVIDLITAEDEQIEDDSFADSDQSEPEPQPGNWRERR